MNETHSHLYIACKGTTPRFEDSRAGADLITSLTNDDEKPWATYNRGHPICARQLSKQLAAYGIKSKTVRLGPHNTPKGYEPSQFDDAFARYLGIESAAVPLDSNCDIAEGVADPLPSPEVTADVSDPDGSLLDAELRARLGMDSPSPRPKTGVALTDDASDGVF